MRIDVVLNKICIVKTRTMAKNACDNDAVIINDKIAKSSHDVKINDVIECNLFGYKTIIKITKIPEGNVSKKDVMTYYQIINRNQVL